MVLSSASDKAKLFCKNFFKNSNLDDSVLYINFLPNAVICDIDIYADDTNLYPKHNQISDLWQQLELVCEIESDLDFNAGNTQLV